MGSILVYICLSFRLLKRYNKSFKRDICCFDFRSNFLVSISFLINVGKEMSLPGFRSEQLPSVVVMLHFPVYVFVDVVIVILYRFCISLFHSAFWSGYAL